MSHEDFIARQERLGKRMLQIIVICNLTLFAAILMMSLLNGIVHNLLGLLIMIVLCVWIYYGGKIAKWAYIVVNAFQMFSLLVVFTFGEVSSGAPAFLNMLTVVMLILSMVTCAVLLFSKSVNDFMYKQRG